MDVPPRCLALHVRLPLLPQRSNRAVCEPPPPLHAEARSCGRSIASYNRPIQIFLVTFATQTALPYHDEARPFGVNNNGDELRGMGMRLGPEITFHKKLFLRQEE